MRVSGPFSFSVAHSGRGGRITCRCAAGTIDLTLEMHANGTFSTGVGGARVETPAGAPRPLDAGERAAVVDALRAWLDETERHTWVVEPARAADAVSWDDLRQISAAFPPTRRAAVVTHLAQYRGPEEDRVRGAILELADGDLAAVADLAVLARADHRALLERADRERR